MITIVISSAETLTVSRISVGRCRSRDPSDRVVVGTFLGGTLALVEEVSDIDRYRGLQSPEVVDRRDNLQEEVLGDRSDQSWGLLFELGVAIERIFFEEERSIH